ncbi:hypothetical protein OEZ85_012082 [Tetradesmus obliquus]|uniref:Uncharacterized protein n=1 Tax=Tetradesmus obliquus TaxID=3088 RepID=A0ABY8TW87_TETOB|nr:hypothetical protein OEZ85_012082 [Tetradesmus obliquus]
MDNFEPGAEVSTNHNLYSTRGNNISTSVSTTTWFAIPTSSASNLPPTPSRHYASASGTLRTPAAHSSSGRKLRTPSSSSKHNTPYRPYSSGTGYTSGHVTGGYTPGGVTSTGYSYGAQLAGNSSSQIHQSGYNSYAGLPPQAPVTTPGGSVITPGKVPPTPRSAAAAAAAGAGAAGLSTPSRRPQEGTAASGSLFNSWASNIVTGGGNRDTVSGVLDLLTGDPGASAAGASFSAARNSSRALCSSSDSDSDSGEMWGVGSAAATPSAAQRKTGSSAAPRAGRAAGGYFTPVRRPSFEMRVESGTAAPATGGFAGMSPAFRAAALAPAGVPGATGAAALPNAAAAAQPVQRFSRVGPAAGSLLVGGYDFEVSDDEDDTMVTRAGKSISGALFAAPEGMGMSRSGLASFIGASSSGVSGVAGIPALLTQQRFGSQLQRQGSLRFEPPRAPARPAPSVMLVPACDAPEIAMSMEGLLVE